MGINLFLKLIQDDLSFLENYAGVWFAVIGLHIIGMFYFGLIHNKRSRSWISAGVLSAIGVGIGQAYNGRMKKAMVYLCVYLSGMVIFQLGVLHDNLIGLAIWGIIILCVIDAGIGAPKQTKIQLYWNEITSNALLDYGEKNYDLAIDTNIFIEDADLLEHLLYEESMDLYVSMIVFKELEDLKVNEDSELRESAENAFEMIEDFQRVDRLFLLKTPNAHAIRKYRLGDSADEMIIGTYMLELNKGNKKLLFLSNDQMARIIARSVDMPTAEM